MALQAGTMITAEVRLVRHLGDDHGDSFWVADHGALRIKVVVRFLAGSGEAPEDWLPTMPVLDVGLAADGTPFVVKQFTDDSPDEPVLGMTTDEYLETGRYIEKRGLEVEVADGDDSEESGR
jgi:hypothetical protein